MADDEQNTPEIEIPDTMTLGEMLSEYSETKKKYKRINDELHRVGALKDAYETVIINKLQEMGLTQIKNEYGTISIAEDVYAQIEDLDVFYQHILETEQPFLLQKRPNLTAFRELLAKGEGVPGLKPFTRRRLIVCK